MHPEWVKCSNCEANLLMPERPHIAKEFTPHFVIPAGHQDWYISPYLYQFTTFCLKFLHSKIVHLCNTALWVMRHCFSVIIFGLCNACIKHLNYLWFIVFFLRLSAYRRNGMAFLACWCHWDYNRKGSVPGRWLLSPFPLAVDKIKDKFTFCVSLWVGSFVVTIKGLTGELFAAPSMLSLVY